jgi:copper chaperone CopZ
MTNVVELSITGMHCAGCVRRVTAALGEVDGLSDVSVEVGTARFTAEDAEGSEQAIRAVQALGFEVTTPPASTA